MAKATTQDSSLLKPAKIAISKNPKNTKSKPYLVAKLDTATKSASKIAIAPNTKPKATKATKETQPDTGILNLKNAIVSTDNTVPQSIVINTMNLPQAQSQTPQEPLSSLCDFEKTFGTTTTTTVAPVNTDESVLKQQEFDMQIQLQLQSILNGTAPAQINDDQKKSKEITISPVSKKTSVQVVKEPMVTESMPSLDDFFCIGLNNNDSEAKSITPSKQSKPQLKSKSKATKEGAKTETSPKQNKKLLPKSSPITTPVKGTFLYLFKKNKIAITLINLSVKKKLN